MNPTLRIALLHQGFGGGGTAAQSTTPVLSARVASVTGGSRVASATK